MTAVLKIFGIFIEATPLPKLFNTFIRNVMSDRLKCAGKLNRLLENNFFIAKFYRRTVEVVEEESLVKFFKKKASRRFQFAVELGEEIGFLKESYSSYGPFSPFRRKPAISSDESLKSLLKKCINNDREIYKRYKKAISETNEGSTREILLRHMSFIENSIEDLEALEALANSEERNDLQNH